MKKRFNGVIARKKRIAKKEKKELRDYKKFIIPFFEKGYTITDMFRIKNMARHILIGKSVK